MGKLMDKNLLVNQVSGRKTIEIKLPDGRIYEGPRMATVETFLKVLPEWQNPPIVGAVVNSALRELTFRLEMDSIVMPVTMADPDGARIYRRSITFLLEAAFQELFPVGTVTVDHAVASGGFYCQTLGRDPLSVAELEKLEKHMQKLVTLNLPFERKLVPIDEAIQYFAQMGHEDKVHLLRYRQKKHLVLYELGNHKDYHHGYMVPSTGYLKWFSLNPLGDDAFVLCYPRRRSPTSIFPMPEYPKLLGTFKQYGEWLARLGVENVGSLNDAITAKQIRELVLVSEALHERQIAGIAEKIVEKSASTRIVLIAGPSSSGKTTFSKRLAVQLLSLGISPYALELDNYFVNREKTPLDQDGNYDFEALEALDIKLLGQQLKQMIRGEEVQIPAFNFKEGKSEPGKIVKLQQDQVIILEGIHGLNPQLLPDTDPSSVFKIYISCLTQLNLDRHNRISTTDTRLIRRIVRDVRERGYSAYDTIQRWESVRRGEKQHIFKYQENADEIFNSALVYELSALKPIVEPYLRQVPFGTIEYIEAKRLLTFLEWFLPVEADIIPDNSILREFIGGSILKNFKLWKYNHTD